MYVDLRGKGGGSVYTKYMDGGWEAGVGQSPGEGGGAVGGVDEHGEGAGLGREEKVWYYRGEVGSFPLLLSSFSHPPRLEKARARGQGHGAER